MSLGMSCQYCTVQYYCTTGKLLYCVLGYTVLWGELLSSPLYTPRMIRVESTWITSINPVVVLESSWIIQRRQGMNLDDSRMIRNVLAHVRNMNAFLQRSCAQEQAHVLAHMFLHMCACSCEHNYAHKNMRMFLHVCARTCANMFLRKERRADSTT